MLYLIVIVIVIVFFTTFILYFSFNTFLLPSFCTYVSFVTSHCMHCIKPNGLKGHMNVENGFKAFNLLGQTDSKTITATAEYSMDHTDKNGNKMKKEKNLNFVCHSKWLNM